MARPRGVLSFEAITLLVAFAIVGVSGLIALQAEEQQRVNSGWLRHTLEVESALRRLDGSIRRAESEARGYIITGNTAYAGARDHLSGQIERQLTEISVLVADNPQQTQHLEELRPVLRERLKVVQTLIDLVVAGRSEEAAEVVRQGRGKDLSDQIDAIVGDMIAVEEDLYRQREIQMSKLTDSLQIANGSLIILLAGVATLAIAIAQKQMNALQKSNEATRLAYNELISETTRRSAVEAQLRQSQKLDALGQLAGGIAHDFNNMLGVIVASLNILRRKIQREEGGLEQLIDSGLDGADRAAALVRRLLAFSRIQPLNPQPLDANTLVSGMSELLRRTLGAQVQLATALADGLWITKVDPGELENVILNLAVNARDAMPTGGQLTIETTNIELDESYVQNNPDTRPGEYILIAVSDTGQGMPPEVAAKAFDPFFTTKAVGKGTGLGLSQAHGFVKQSGGHIKIYSEIGSGTCVKLYLPRYLEKGAAPPPPAPSSIEDFPHGTADEIILVVEDDDNARRLTSQGVRELGYTVLEAGNGKDAIEILRERADIRLLITDVVMPGMDGAHLAREAVFRRHGIQVMFMTGYAEHAVRSGILDPKVNLLTKPFTLAQLARKIRDILDSRPDLPKGTS